MDSEEDEWEQYREHWFALSEVYPVTYAFRPEGPSGYLAPSPEMMCHSFTTWRDHWYRKAQA